MVSNNTKFTINAAMANCIKQLVFSQTNGVDLTPIVEDLGGSDMTAIAVALAYKGIKPEIDTATRFEPEYGKTYAMYEFKSYSVIMDTVLVSKTCITWNKYDNKWESSHPQEISLLLSRWLDMPTSKEDCIAKICPEVKTVGEESHTVLRKTPKI